MYSTLQKALDGSLTGHGTVLLCETLLSYLTAFQVNQPMRLLKAYDILPSGSNMADQNRTDLWGGVRNSYPDHDGNRLHTEGV